MNLTKINERLTKYDQETLEQFSRIIKDVSLIEKEKFKLEQKTRFFNMFWSKLSEVHHKTYTGFLIVCLGIFLIIPNIETLCVVGCFMIPVGILIMIFTMIEL